MLSPHEVGNSGLSDEEQLAVYDTILTVEVFATSKTIYIS